MLFLNHMGSVNNIQYNYYLDIYLKDVIWRYYGERENSEN